MEKDSWHSILPAALLPAGMTAAGVMLIRLYVNDPGALFWLGMALAAAGMWSLAAVLRTIKNDEARELERVTGLRFKKGFYAVSVGAQELEGELDGSAITFRKTDGASKRVFSSEIVFTFEGQAEAGFSLAVFPKGIALRPFGFFPPALPAQPAWAVQAGLVLRGKPEGEAGAAAERLWNASGGGLPAEELRLLKIWGRSLRAEFVRRESPYEPEDVKRLLELCLKIYQSRI